MALDGALLGAAAGAKFCSLAAEGWTRISDGAVLRTSSGVADSCKFSARRKDFLGSALLCRQDGDGIRRSTRSSWRFCVGGGGICQVRAEAEVADGPAGPNTGIGASGSARKGRDDDGGSEKAQALSDSAIYPVMRVYRNDLCSLEITGDAKAWEVVGAMAADGGFTASEELSRGRALMTVETIVPGRSDDHSTVSTKLLAPTKLVNKRAKLTKGVGKNKGSLSSGNALARAFQSVVLQRVLAFDLRIQGAGTVRDMSNLANEKEVGVIASMESRDGRILEGLAEAVCSYVIANIKDTYQRRASGKGGFSRLVPFWTRPKQVWGLDKAICLSPLGDNEIWENTRRVLQEPTFSRDSKPSRVVRTHQSWWPLSDASSASGFLTEEALRNFSNEFVPVHKIQIDTSVLRVEAKGWQRTKTDNILELQLTHSQLVDIADMMDLFYEDGHTVPAKELRSGMDLSVSQNSRSKVARALWTLVASSLAGGLLIVGLLVASRMRSSFTANLRTSSRTSTSSSRVSETSLKNRWCTPKYNRQALLPSNNEIPPEEMEALCSQVVVRMKDAFKLDGDVQSGPEKGAWLGPDITDWGRKRSSAQVAGQETPGDNNSVESRDVYVNEIPKTGRMRQPHQEVVLLYQVMLSRDGKVLGFQPGNKPAIVYWANYPFAEELHRGRRLGPGLVEPGLRYMEPPRQAVAIELLCRPHSVTPSIAARPLKVTSNLRMSETS